MTESLPQRFEDLKPTELYRSALEDFAIDVAPEDKNKKTVLLAAFVESGVTWNDYVAQHPEVAPAVDTVAETLQAGGVVTSSDVSRENVASTLSVEPVQEEVIIHTPKAPVYQPNEKLLVKMERENPLYEVRGYRFTTKNPYALVSPEDADYIISHEIGFRQALPREVQEFYG